MASMAIKQVINIMHAFHLKSSPSSFVKPYKSPTFISTNNIVQFLSLAEFSSKRNLVAVSKASSPNNIPSIDDDEEGVSLGTMKLPSDTDVARFETLLFQVLYTTFKAIIFFSKKICYSCFSFLCHHST